MNRPWMEPSEDERARAKVLREINRLAAELLRGTGRSYGPEERAATLAVAAQIVLLTDVFNRNTDALNRMAIAIERLAGERTA